MKLDEEEFGGFSLPEERAAAPRNGGIAALFTQEEEGGNSSFKYRATATTGGVENAQTGGGGGGGGPEAAVSTGAPLTKPAVVAATTFAQLYRIEGAKAGNYRALGVAGCAVFSGKHLCSLLVYDQRKTPFFKVELSRKQRFSARGLYLFTDAPADTTTSGNDKSDGNGAADVAAGTAAAPAVRWSMLLRDESEFAKLARVILCAQITAAVAEGDGTDGSTNSPSTHRKEGLTFGDADTEPLRAEEGDTVMCSFTIWAWQRESPGGFIELERNDKVKFWASDHDKSPAAVPALGVDEVVGMKRGSTRVVAGHLETWPAADKCRTRLVSSRFPNLVLEMKLHKIKKKEKAATGSNADMRTTAPEDDASEPTATLPGESSSASGTTWPDAAARTVAPSPSRSPSSSSGRSGTLKERMARLGQKVPIALPPKVAAARSASDNGDASDETSEDSAKEEEEGVAVTDANERRGAHAPAPDADGHISRESFTNTATDTRNTEAIRKAHSTEFHAPATTADTSVPAVRGGISERAERWQQVPQPSNPPAHAAPLPVTPAGASPMAPPMGSTPPPWWYTASSGGSPMVMMPGTLNDDYSFKATVMEAIRGLAEGQSRISHEVQLLAERGSAGAPERAATTTEDVDDEAIERTGSHGTQDDENKIGDEDVEKSGDSEEDNELASLQSALDDMRRERDDALELLERRACQAEDDKKMAAQQAEEIETYLQEVIRGKEEEITTTRTELAKCQKLLAEASAEAQMEKEEATAQKDQDEGEEAKSDSTGRAVDDASVSAEKRRAAKSLMQLVFKELGGGDDGVCALDDDAVTKVKDIFRRCFKQDSAWLGGTDSDCMRHEG